MESKNYTNIAGSPFQPFVKKQIEERKKLVSKENRTNSDLQWLSNKSAWIRISSNANVLDENSNFIERGDTLSRKYILQAGLTDHSKVINQKDDIFTLREGLGPNGAYGLGGTKEFGYRPMPGLTSLSIKTGGKLGTLREASFEFTCYNMEQLTIMDALYMKLGFSVLIEWGHIPYIKNNYSETNKIETIPQPMDFYGIDTKEVLMKKIQELRVTHAGNYDAMWGTVKNFSYSFEGNGTFVCKVDLVGAGDVLESLKINQSGNATAATPSGSTQGQNPESPYPVVANSNLSLLNQALYKIYERNLEEANYDVNIDNSIGYFNMLRPFLKKREIDIGQGSYFTNTPVLAQKGFQFSLLTGLNQKTGNGGDDVNIPIIPDPVSFYSRLVMGYEIDGEESTGTSKNEKGLEQVYITLGHLLMLIMSNGWMDDKDENKPDAKRTPYVYIDINTETNRCYTFPGHCSLDPTVCLIASQQLPFGIQTSLLGTLRRFYPFYDTENSGYGGKFMNTLVNINWVASVLKTHQTSNPKGDVSFVDFMQDVLSGISKACGGFNEFRIVPDDDSRCVRIFDDKRLTAPLAAGEESPYTTIPVLGKESLVYSFSYTSKISPNTAAMTVISAQAEPAGLGDEAFAFSHLSKGLTNRISPARSTSTSDENAAQTAGTIADDSEDRYIELRDHIKNIYGGTGGELTVKEAAAIKESTEANANLKAAGVNDETRNINGTVTFSGPRI
ncbi:hypothetical protein N9795_01130 [Candidatus Pelagibacter sp.]|nr:hypothetical protein [Candidatus Pelagibacter sp.]